MKALAIALIAIITTTYLALSAVDKALDDTKAAIHSHTTNLED